VPPPRSGWATGATAPTARTWCRSGRGTIPRSCGPGWRPAFCGPSHWPEIGRFIQQDPEGDGINWYVYVANNPLVWADPEGLHETASFWHNLFDPDVAGCQLGMSARATLSGIVAGATFGLWQPDWADPCDPYARFSKGAGIVAGGALITAAGLGVAEAAGVRGANPWLGTTARHGAHHGRGPHWQVIVRVGRHASRTLLRIGGRR